MCSEKILECFLTMIFPAEDRGKCKQCNTDRDKVYIKEFKNLKEFSVELDTEQLTNVFIGKNGAGKSNFIEALVIIFRDLDLKTVTIEFSY